MVGRVAGVRGVTFLTSLSLSLSYLSQNLVTLQGSIVYTSEIWPDLS